MEYIQKFGCAQFCRFILMLAIALLTWASAAHASEAPDPVSVRVPIFFVTDRNLEASTENAPIFGPHRKYLGDCKHDPFLGTATCVMRNTPGRNLGPELIDLGWSEANAGDREGTISAKLIQSPTFPETENAFYSQLRTAALKSKRKEIVLFIHGYKNPFEPAARTAARFSDKFETPVVLYSWPSVAKVRSYTSDENNIEWSQDHFNDMIVNLEKICTADPPIRMRIFAHSMGSRLVVRAMPFLRERLHIVEAGLICPDVDRGLVNHYAGRYFSSKGKTTVRLYMSQHDRALALSQIVHGGYTRLGECADSLAGIARDAMKSRITTPTEATDQEVRDMFEKAKHRMQTIDFTLIDRGLIGHHIPTELIRNLSYTNEPGEGWALVPQESGQRSRASRLLSKLTRLSVDTLVPSETCFRLVKADSVKTASGPSATK